MEQIIQEAHLCSDEESWITWKDLTIGTTYKVLNIWTISAGFFDGFVFVLDDNKLLVAPDKLAKCFMNPEGYKLPGPHFFIPYKNWWHVLNKSVS